MTTTRIPARPFHLSCIAWGGGWSTPIQCVQVKPERGGGYRVVIDIVPPSMDDLWEHVEHFALFADKGDAEALALAIRARRVIDLDAYVWIPSHCTPFALFQAPPTVTREKNPRGSTGRNVHLRDFRVMSC